MKIAAITPVDVEHFPDVLEEGVLYISESFELAAHRCCCGCGEEVITPLNPSRWRLYRNGSRVSLVPSIGNWKFNCRSHYWIRNNRVVQSFDMDDDDVAKVISDDQRDRERYFAELSADAPASPSPGSAGVWGRLTRWIHRVFFAGPRS